MSKGRTKSGKRAAQKTLNKAKKKPQKKGAVVKKRSKKVTSMGASAMDTDDAAPSVITGMKMRKPAMKLARTAAEPKKKAKKKKNKAAKAGMASGDGAAAMQE